MIMRLIFINVGIFLALYVVATIFMLFYGRGGYEQFFFYVNDWLAVPLDFKRWIYRPWTPFTYMFLHSGFWHLFWNIMFFYWLGQIAQNVLSDRRMLAVYILGGLAGAIVATSAVMVFPGLNSGLAMPMVGASAAIMAVIVAGVTVSPDYGIYIFIFGPFKAKYIVGLFLLRDFVMIPQGNAGGLIAHLGGATMGWLFIHQLRRGRDLSAWLFGLTDALAATFKSKPKGPQKGYVNPERFNKPKPVQPRSANDVSEQDRVDMILEKIKQSGYDSLTKEEKDFLFTASKK
jgi:membrane associated rhomboid family serine protease